MKLTSLSARDRRVLTIGAVIAIPGLLWPLALKPYLNELATVREQTVDERDRLVKEQRAIAEIPMLPAMRAQASQRLGGEINRLFQSSDDLIATGDLAQYVAAAAQGNGLHLQQSETRSPHPVIPGLQALQVDVKAEGDLDGLLRFLRYLESGGKLVRIGELSIAGVHGSIESESAASTATVPDDTGLVDDIPPGGFGGRRRRRQRLEREDGQEQVQSLSLGQGDGQGQVQSLSLGQVDGQGRVQSFSLGQVDGQGRAQPQVLQFGGGMGGGLLQALQSMMAPAKSRDQGDGQGQDRPLNRVPGTAEVLSLSFSIYGYRLSDTPWSSTDTRGKSAATPFTRTAYEFESLDAIVDHDPFSPTRSRPSVPYRFGDENGQQGAQRMQQAREQELRRGRVGLQLLGTIMSPGQKSFAMVHLRGSDDAPQAVHVGETFNGYTVVELHPGTVVFTTSHGDRLEKKLPEPGSSE